MYPARVIVSTHKIHFSLCALYFCKLFILVMRSGLFSCFTFIIWNETTQTYYVNEEWGKNYKKVGQKKLTDYVILYTKRSYCVRLSLSMHEVCLSVTAIFFKIPRRNWSKKLENVRNREGEEKKAEFPRISRLDSWNQEQLWQCSDIFRLFLLS